MKIYKKNFTLAEVLVALAILAIGVLSATQLLTSARQRSQTAYELWEEQHAVTQAAEYILLTGVEQDIPERFFPFEEYKINAWQEKVTNLDADVPQEKGGWELVTLFIQLSHTEKKIEKKIAIDRIVPSGEILP